MSDVLVRIKRAVLVGRYRFSEKARLEMRADGQSERSENRSEIMRLAFCPSCGSKKLKRVCRNLVEVFQGQRYSVQNLEFHECPDCGEKIYDSEAMRRIEAVSPAFRNRSAVMNR